LDLLKASIMPRHFRSIPHFNRQAAREFHAWLRENFTPPAFRNAGGREFFSADEI
jgi:hypothetical protein